MIKNNAIAARRTGISIPLARLFPQWKLEIEEFAARRGFPDAGHIQPGMRPVAGLEIKKPAGGLPRWNHLGRKSAAFDLPGVERVLLARDAGTARGERPGDDFRLRRPA